MSRAIHRYSYLARKWSVGRLPVVHSKSTYSSQQDGIGMGGGGCWCWIAGIIGSSSFRITSDFYRWRWTRLAQCTTEYTTKRNNYSKFYYSCRSVSGPKWFGVKIANRVETSKERVMWDWERISFHDERVWNPSSIPWIDYWPIMVYSWPSPIESNRVASGGHGWIGLYQEYYSTGTGGLWTNTRDHHGQEWSPWSYKNREQ